MSIQGPLRKECRPGMFYLRGYNNILEDDGAS
jgi:hypothetical protein